MSRRIDKANAIRKTELKESMKPIEHIQTELVEQAELTQLTNR